ncbi:MAG: two-component regulator propeller domain-containing protein [Bacteroidota bacterium]
MRDSPAYQHTQANSNSPPPPPIRLSYVSGIRAILEDSQGRIWFGSHNEGVCLLRGDTLTYFTVADGLSNNQVRSIYEDRAGQIWFECGEGISVYDGERLAVWKEKNYGRKHQWSGGVRDLWFKSDPSTGHSEIEEFPGVYRYDGEAMYYHAFPIYLEEEVKFGYSISASFARGQGNEVWLGTYSAVIGYDGEACTFITNDLLGLNENTGYLHVRSIYVDSNGDLWIGNNGIGVLKYDGEEVVNVSRQHGLISLAGAGRGGYRSTETTLEHIFAIGEDKHGNIWFGDRDTGAWMFDGESMKNYGLEAGLPVTHIWQIYTTKTGELWFAMADGSVQRFVEDKFERVF